MASLLSDKADCFFLRDESEINNLKAVLGAGWCVRAFLSQFWGPGGVRELSLHSFGGRVVWELSWHSLGSRCRVRGFSSAPWLWIQLRLLRRALLWVLLCQQVAGSGVRCLQLLSTLTLHCFIPLHIQKKVGKVVGTQESVSHLSGFRHVAWKRCRISWCGAEH